MLNNCLNNNNYRQGYASLKNNTNTNYNNNNKQSLTNIVRNNNNNDDEDYLISHLLAHTIRDQDTDKFITIYDTIPRNFTQTRVIFFLYLMNR